jgi:hypothetical protein
MEELRATDIETLLPAETKMERNKRAVREPHGQILKPGLKCTEKPGSGLDESISRPQHVLHIDHIVPLHLEDPHRRASKYHLRRMPKIDETDWHRMKEA